MESKISENRELKELLDLHVDDKINRIKFKFKRIINDKKKLLNKLKKDIDDNPFMDYDGYYNLVDSISVLEDTYKEVFKKL